MKRHSDVLSVSLSLSSSRSYSVVVEKTDETFRGAALRPFSWRSLAALSRITGSVSKVTGGWVQVVSGDDACV